MKRSLEFIALNQKKILLGILLLCILFPLITSNPYTLRLAILSGIFIILTASLNLLTGFAGQISIGHIAFYGIGAYTAGILSKSIGTNFIVNLILAIIIAGLFGFLLGLPALKLSGYYLAIVTLGFSEIIRLVEINWMELTNGPLGIINIPKPQLFGIKLSSPQAYYYICLFLVVLTILCIYRLVNSRTGLAFKAIKGDLTVARFMGINVLKYKVTAFVISSSMAGMAGAFFAHYVTFIDPTSFAADQSTLVLLMAILGGLGSMPGAVIGAVVITIIPEVLRGLAEYRMLLYGIVLVVMMLIRPQGLLGKFNFDHLRLRTIVKTGKG